MASLAFKEQAQEHQAARRRPRIRRHLRKKAYRAYLREMTNQGLINLPDGSWGSYTRSASYNGGMSPWKAVYCGTNGKASRRLLPAYGLHPKVRKQK